MTKLYLYGIQTLFLMIGSAAFAAQGAYHGQFAASPDFSRAAYEVAMCILLWTLSRESERAMGEYVKRQIKKLEEA